MDEHSIGKDYLKFHLESQGPENSEDLLSTINSDFAKIQC